MISSKSRYVREYRRYHRTHRRMITSSKCRPRNRAGRLRVTIHLTRSVKNAFATKPDSTFLSSPDFSTAPLGYITVTETHTITGGTGRFAGAQGSFILERTHLV